MFKFAQTTPAKVRFSTPTGSVEFTMHFRWLPATERLRHIEARDREIESINAEALRQVTAAGERPESETPPEPDALLSALDLELVSERTRRIVDANAALVSALAEDWDIPGEAGEPVPFTQENIAALLDLAPGVFAIIQEVAQEATSIRALEKN